MKYLINFLKGIAVAVATMVPGVSGGTMAIIFGIYDDLLHSIGHFFDNWKKHTIFLLQIGLGGLMGLVVFSKVINFALDKFPFEMSFLFFGIICGGIPVLFKKAASETKKIDYKNLIFLLIGFVIVLAMSGEEEAAATMATAQNLSSIIFLFIGGIILAVALILPGISGSFMLLALGLYKVTMGAIESRNIPYLIPLGLGVVVGTLATTRAIENLMKKYPGKTYMLILGFVGGSLIAVFPGMPQGVSIVTSVMALVIGFVVIRWISKKDISE